MPVSLDEQQLLLQARIEGLAAGVAEDITATLEAALEENQGRVLLLGAKAGETPSLIRKKSYLEKQATEIEKVLDDVYSAIGKDAKTEATKIAKDLPPVIHKSYRAALPKGLAIRLGEPKLSTNQVVSWFESFEMDGLLFNQWLNRAGATTRQSVIKAAKDSLIFAEKPTDAVRRLAKTFEIARKRADQLVRDAVHGAHSYAEEVYQVENEKFFDLYRWVSELDVKTCPRCGDLDGETWEDPRDVLRPPIHTRCRCRIRPEIKDEVKIGTRIARIDDEGRVVKHRDGSTSTKRELVDVDHPPRSLRYKQWIGDLAKSSDPAKVRVAREVLGPTRLKLVQSGKLSVDRVFYHGRLRTLDEIKDLMP